MILPQSERRPGFLERIWISLWSLTPANFRRMSLLSSLYARFAECDGEDDERLRKINRELGLTRDIVCMKFSVLCAPLVWKRVLPVTKIDEQRSERYIDRLLHTTPCWLKYGEDDLIRKEMIKLLDYCFKERTAVGSI